MFNGLIEGGLARAIADSATVDDITEIRMRVGRPLVVMTRDMRFAVKISGLPYIVSRSDVERVLNVASNFSVYSVNDELIKGYIPCGNVRLGVAGEGVMDNGKLMTLKNVSYLVLRIPHQIKGAADSVFPKVFCGGVKNTLVISPPGAGKTTMLRELARLASERRNVVLIDERYELAAVGKGNALLDVGDADIVSGIPKAVAYENCVRALNPEIIVTDELFKRAEVEAVCDIVRSGVNVFASVHGDGVEAVRRSDIFCGLLDAFDLAIVLSKTPRIGAVKEIVEL